jgi:zinc metalloprotease ZmpB
MLFILSIIIRNHEKKEAVMKNVGKDQLWNGLALLAILALCLGVLAPATPALAVKPNPGTATGSGLVFLPNPVAALQNQSLTDQKDADYPALQPAYREVVLTNLDGSGYLHGDWATVASETGNPAYSPTNTFFYNRHDDEFEQVMAYYWVTEAQKYIQSLGFDGVHRRAIHMKPQRVRINQWGLDNSFSTDHKDELRFGKGGVDDAEDAEVILHEYGHSMQGDQNPNLVYSGETGGIMEGFSDYWAAEVSQLIAPTPDPACIADWDSVSYTLNAPHCLRRLDTNKHYPEDLTSSVHRNGLIWSQALWEIRLGLGDNVTADTIILEAQFDFTPATTMPEAAQVTMATAERLYGKNAARIVRSAFMARGILP